MSKTSWGVLHLMTVPKICHKLSPYAKRKAFKIDINHFDIPVKEQVSEEISTSCKLFWYASNSRRLTTPTSPLGFAGMDTKFKPW